MIALPARNIDACRFLPEPGADIDTCQYVAHTEAMSPTDVTLTTRPTADAVLDLAVGRSQGPIPEVACCAPLVREPLSAEDAVGLAKVLKAIADPARLRVLSLVAAHQDGDACVCDLTEPLALSQPTVSHHLKVLVDAGLLNREKRGVWAHYRLVPGALDDVARVLLTTSQG